MEKLLKLLVQIETGCRKFVHKSAFGGIVSSPNVGESLASNLSLAQVKESMLKS